MIQINSEQIYALEKQYRISLINSIVGYKPVHLLGTINSEALTNLCIVSSVFHLGANPPVLGMVIRPEREHNSSLKNIKQTGQYTLNNVLPDWYKQAHQTSASYPLEISEFTTCDFKEYYADGFKAPFVSQSTIRLGLNLKELIEISINNTTIVIGEIMEILVDDGLIAKDGNVNHIEAKTMTVAGLDSYFLPNFVGKLSYAKPGTEPPGVLIL